MHYNFRIIFILIFLMFFTFTKPVWALSCYLPDGQELLDQYSIIVKAIYVPSPNGQIATFIVKKIYKGEVARKIISIVNTGSSFSKPISLEQRNSYVLFLNKEPYSIGGCSPNFSIEDLNVAPQSYWQQIYTLIQLEIMNVTTFAEQKKIIEDLSITLPKVPFIFAKWAEVLEREGNYDFALQAYRIVLRQTYLEIMQRDFPNQNLEQLASNYDSLSHNSLGVPDKADLYIQGKISNFMVAYGTILYKQKRYKESMKAFELCNELQSNDDVNKMYLDALAKSNNGSAH